MEVTELGIVIEVKPMQKVNALFPMEVTELGMMVFLQPATNSLVLVLIMELQLPLESYTVLPLSTTIRAILLQFLNAPIPMEITELGISIEVKP